MFLPLRGKCVVQKLGEVFLVLCLEPGPSREQSQSVQLPPPSFVLAFIPQPLDPGKESQKVSYKLSELRVKVIRLAQGIALGRVGRLPTLPKTD